MRCILCTCSYSLWSYRAWINKQWWIYWYCLLTVPGLTRLLSLRLCVQSIFDPHLQPTEQYKTELLKYLGNSNPFDSHHHHIVVYDLVNHSLSRQSYLGTLEWSSNTRIAAYSVSMSLSSLMGQRCGGLGGFTLAWSFPSLRGVAAQPATRRWKPTLWFLFLLISRPWPQFHDSEVLTA